MLSEAEWRELIELGVLDGDETCALCRERPLVLLDVARAPILLCAVHADEVMKQLRHDLESVVRDA